MLNLSLGIDTTSQEASEFFYEGEIMNGKSFGEGILTSYDGTQKQILTTK